MARTSGRRPRRPLASWQPVLLLALVVLSQGAALGAVASEPSTGQGAWTLPVEAGPLSGPVALHPADPRSPAAAEQAPEAARELYAAELPAHEARLHVVALPQGTVGLLAFDGQVTWLTLQNGVLTHAPPPSDDRQPVRIDGGGLATTQDGATDLGDHVDDDGVLQILLDGDVPYWWSFRERWNEHQLAVIHLVDLVFRANLDVRIEVVAQHVWTPESSDRPVTSDYLCPEGTQPDLLRQFRDFWETAMPTTTASREAAHLFTTRDLETENVGCAFLRQLETDAAYGVTRIGTFEIFDTLYQDVMVVAHEIGHNFGGEHELAEGPVCGGTILLPGFCYNRPLFSGSEDHQIAEHCLGVGLFTCQRSGNVAAMRDYGLGRI